MRKSTIWYLMDPAEGFYHLIADVLKFGAFKLLLLGAGHQAVWANLWLRRSYFEWLQLERNAPDCNAIVLLNSSGVIVLRSKSVSSIGATRGGHVTTCARIRYDLQIGAVFEWTIQFGWKIPPTYRMALSVSAYKNAPWTVSIAPKYLEICCKFTWNQKCSAEGGKT